MDNIEKYARLNAQGVVVETFVPVDDRTGKAVDIGKVFNKETAALFVPCPPEAAAGSVLAGKKWTHPAAGAQERMAQPPRSLSVMEFYLAFTPAERIAIKDSKDRLVQEFWATYEMAVRTESAVDVNLPSVLGALEYLATSVKMFDAARIPDILAGVPQ